MRRAGLLFCALGILIAARTARAESISTAINIGGYITHGEIVGYDDQSFRFKLRDTGEVVKLSWNTLAEVERARVQRLVGYKAAAEEAAPEQSDPDDLPARPRYTGRMIDIIAVRIADSDRTLRGIELKDRETRDAIFIKTRTAPAFRIEKKIIASITPGRANELEYYSGDEIYDRIRADINPTTARHEYELGLLCMDLKLFLRALNHFERAGVLDARMAERLGPVIKKARKEIARGEARAVYHQAMLAIQNRNYVKALEKIEELEMAFPDSEFFTRLLQKKPQIIERRDRQLQKQVITAFYRHMTNFVIQAVHNKVTDGEEIPGKYITIKSGHTYMGVLKDETEDTYFLKQWDSKNHREGNTEYQIDKRQVTRIVNTNLNKNKRMRTFEECKTYVTDSDGGISADIRTALAREFHVAEDEVKKIWENRLNKTHVVGPDGRVQSTQRLVSYREAYYGKGSWLRDGVRAVSTPTRTTRSGGRWGRNRKQQQAMTKKTSADAEADPEIWWRAQKFEQRESILRAICAEAIMDIVRFDRIRCPVCGGKGSIGAYGTTGMGMSFEPCPHCRGLKSLIKVIYR